MALLYKRSVRVGELVHKIVAEVVREINSLDANLVTITGVKLTDDLLNCKIYYSVFGAKDGKKKTDDILKKNVKNVRYQLAWRLNLRYVPIISFVYDNTDENVSKIFDLIKKIKKEN
ncbi:MAG: 30S ribosome-binding factor RbfA [Endomicrobium sp.]|jgi:ribosome-binding factor A|nr:30S ribosome-binding factor RbfA [Endomicrobium sp.]